MVWSISTKINYFCRKVANPGTSNPPNLLNLLREEVRNSNPSMVTIQLNSPLHFRFYWRQYSDPVWQKMRINVQNIWKILVSPIVKMSSLMTYAVTSQSINFHILFDKYFFVDVPTN